MSDEIKIRPAATVILLKDTSEGLKLLMLQRNSKLDFAGGFWVFPGGGVEEQDRISDDLNNVAKQAAIRETQEEAGIDISQTTLIDYAHWTTPEGAPKRYATWFLMGEFSEEKEIVIDGSEIHDYQWVSPQVMLDRHYQRDIELLPPTYISLREVNNFSNAKEAITFFDQRSRPEYLPKVVFDEQTIIFLYGGDAGYENKNHCQDGARNRFYMSDAGWEYECNLEGAL